MLPLGDSFGISNSFVSGPWQSESGLDRNVDPMEDSYVKKIISSNEGLNFNKDIAEAGG